MEMEMETTEMETMEMERTSIFMNSTRAWWDSKV
jgi:hypothetical protein